jgi:hypothetical protein
MATETHGSLMHLDLACASLSKGKVRDAICPVRGWGCLWEVVIG